jgi:hypothetical protein
MPPGVDESAWLGSHIAAFGTELRDYKGAAHA